MRWNELDLEISLSPSQVEPVKKWIQGFLSKDGHRFVEPVLENNILKINSSDFVNLLDQTNASDSNEFDLFRLKASALKAIAQAGARKRDPLLVLHYKRCEDIVRTL